MTVQMSDLRSRLTWARTHHGSARALFEPAVRGRGAPSLHLSSNKKNIESERQSAGSDTNANPRYCVIGAGPSGLAAAKNLQESDIDFDCFEASGDIGGLWNPSNPYCAYDSVHLNISKRLMQFIDHPIPKEFPDFLGFEQAYCYLRSYAERFRLYDRISFNTRVQKVVKAGAYWNVWIDEALEPRRYDGIIVANGHHWHARRPEIKGEPNCTILHACDYKGPDQLVGKKVLVVGGGNSGLDIACDASTFAKSSHHSIRRGYHIIPKLIFGRPADMLLERLKRCHLPNWLVQKIATCCARLVVGPYAKYGLPEPEGKMFAAHPAASGRYLELMRHGRIQLHGDLSSISGNTVSFADKTAAEVDLIILCTGYQLSLPFLSEELVRGVRGPRAIPMHMFHPEEESLYFIGLSQVADGGFWQLSDYQSHLLARYLDTRRRHKAIADRFRKYLINRNIDVSRVGRRLSTGRNIYAADHFRYRKAVNRLLKKLPS